jgi:hypothetical protein
MPNSRSLPSPAVAGAAGRLPPPDPWFFVAAWLDVLIWSALQRTALHQGKNPNLSSKKGRFRVSLPVDMMDHG